MHGLLNWWDLISSKTKNKITSFDVYKHTTSEEMWIRRNEKEQKEVLDAIEDSCHEMALNYCKEHLMCVPGTSVVCG